LRADELDLAEKLDDRFASAEWLHEAGGLRRAGVKIHEDVRVGEGAHKAAGGLIRCVARVRSERLDDVGFSGDFTVRPESMPVQLETELRGTALSESALLAVVDGYYARERPEIPGVTPQDWVASIMAATTTEVPA